MLLELIQILRQAELDPTPFEIVEALLLARFLPETDPTTTKGAALTDDLSSPAPAPAATPSPIAQSASVAWLTLQAGGDRLPSVSQGTATALPFRSPRARALPGALKIARALRPLRKRHASSRRIELDEEATVSQIADGGPRTMVWRPRLERWLTVELVLDESLSMHVWRPTLRELRRLLEQLGSFNGVNVWQLNADAASPKLWRSVYRQRCATSAAKLLNPNVRQLVMVVSDCTAAAWHHGGAYQWLVEWARQAQTVLVQVLPRSLWLDTSMIETDVLLSSTQPAMSNQALTVMTNDDDHNYADWLRKGAALPVVTLDDVALAPWAKMVAGVSPQPIAGFVLPDMSELLTETGAATTDTTKDSGADAAARVAAFGTASPLARELARLLATVPLSLPVMQLVQQVRLPQSRQSHLAEIFRSDLLNLPVPLLDQPFDDETIFDFHEGVRDALLSDLTREQKEIETLAILDAVEKFLADRSGQSQVFSGLIVLPESVSAPLNAVQVTPLALAFAHIGARTLRKLNVRLDQAEHWESMVQSYAMLVPELPQPQEGDAFPPTSVPPQTQEISAFTLKGKVIQLPVGATPVDFAYALHTEVGNQCTGAKVNGSIVPLRYRIQNGDTIDILTKPGHQPSRDWLYFIVTPVARREVKRWFTEQQRADSVEAGKKLLAKEAQRLRLKLKTVLETERFKTVMSDQGFGKLEDLYSALGNGKLMPNTVLRYFVTQEDVESAEKAKPSRLQQVSHAVKKALKLGDDRITIKGIDDVLVQRARCCNPIRGEDVFGYITIGKGVTVHAKRCTNAASLLRNRERIVEVEWVGEEKKHNSFSIPLIVTTQDRQGALAALVNAVANTRTNISDTRTTIFDNASAQIEITVDITDVAHLDRVIVALKDVVGVISVERA